MVDLLLKLIILVQELFILLINNPYKLVFQIMTNVVKLYRDARLVSNLNPVINLFEIDFFIQPYRLKQGTVFVCFYLS